MVIRLPFGNQGVSACCAQRTPTTWPIRQALPVTALLCPHVDLASRYGDRIVGKESDGNWITAAAVAARRLF